MQSPSLEEAKIRTTVGHEAGQEKSISIDEQESNAREQSQGQAWQMPREEYLSERKLLVDAERMASQDFDKAILTLAGGALGLSITFMKQIAPNPKLIGLLGGSWFCLSVSLLTLLISFQFSRKAQQRAQDILKYYYSHGKEDKKNIPDRVTTCLNWASLYACFFGVVLLAVFSLFNLP